MSEYLGTIIVATIIVLMVFFIVRGMVKDRKKGKHICGQIENGILVTVT